MKEFKVGDLVEIKSWDEMVKEYGTNLNNQIRTSIFTFNPEMKFLCGKKAHIKSVDCYLIQLDIKTGGFLISKDMIKKIKGCDTSISPYISKLLEWESKGLNIDYLVNQFKSYKDEHIEYLKSVSE